MKVISYLVLLSVLFSACTHHRNSTKSLVSKLGPAELEIHYCLQAAQKRTDLQVARTACLVGTEYATSRLPSSTSAELIEQNSWLLDDLERLYDLWATLKSLIPIQESMISTKTKKFINGKGFAISGETYLGVGQIWAAEFINHANKFAIFCAPGVTLTSDVGAELGLVLVRTRSCQTNQDYAGGFLSFGAGISGEMIGTPLGLELTYSFGIDLPKFTNGFNQARNSGKINAIELVKELNHLNAARISKNFQTLMPVLYYASRVIQIFKLAPPDLPMPGIGNLIKNVLKSDKSLGLKFKDEFHSPEMQAFLKEHRLPQLKQFLGLFIDALTGCDALGGTGAITASLAPASVFVNYQNYHLLLEVPMDDFRPLRNVSALTLLNPYLLSFETLRSVINIAEGLRELPRKVTNKCGKI